nr:ribonuclease H-like domain-containing protein [Tanacetum cinerariifolium]
MFLSQRKYAIEILERAHTVGCNSSRTPVDMKSKLGDGGALVFDLTLYQSLAAMLWTMVCSCFPPLLQISMRIGLVVPLLDVRPQVTVCFLVTTYSPGPLSISRRSLVSVLRRSIAVLPMLLLKLVGERVAWILFSKMNFSISSRADPLHFNLGCNIRTVDFIFDDILNKPIEVEEGSGIAKESPS